MTDNDIVIISEDDDVLIEEVNHCSIEETAVAKSDYTCPVCACTVGNNEEQHICETCGTPHHKDCYEYAGGCAIFGCRKGVIRAKSAGQQIAEAAAPVNLGLMRIWSWVFRLHWLTFLVTALGVIIATMMGAMHYFLTSAIFIISHSLFYFLNGIALIAMLPAIFVPLGALAYMLLLPAAIVMRIHFYSINLALPEGNSAIAKSIADRVDMPQTAVYVRKLNTLLTRIAEFLLVLTTLACITIGGLGLLGLVASSSFFPILAASITLAIVRLIMLPLFNAAIESRITILVTFQNRLIASAKQAKGK